MLSSPPRLDDRGFEDLLGEMLSRVGAHTPEWVPQEGDPGRTLLELFAWLADTVLYRANLVPERQRLAFLRLLGEQMMPAKSAEGVVSLRITNPDTQQRINIAQARVTGPVTFESTTEATLFPLTGECYYKRSLTITEEAELGDLLEGLRDFHDLEEQIDGYITEQAFEEGVGHVDVARDATDRSLWVALLATTPASVDPARTLLAGVGKGAQLLNIGVAPAIEVPDVLEGISVGGAIGHSWSISRNEVIDGAPQYKLLDVIDDTTRGLRSSGVQRLGIPGSADDFGVLNGDVRVDANAGVGDRPPRLDDPEKIARVVTWLRLTPEPGVESLSLDWVGINAIPIDQRQTVGPQVVGQSDGRADQVITLPWQSVDPDSLEVQVEEPNQGWIRWYSVRDLALVGRDDAAFLLNSREGTLTFGNGARGRIPSPGVRIRVASARIGGGSVGNLVPQSLTSITAFAPDGSQVTEPLQVDQSVRTDGGVDTESLEEAERRIPQRLRHRNRSVTAEDFVSLASETPGVRLGRVEVLPRFMPQQRRSNVPGVVSVMVLPGKDEKESPNPRPDGPLIEKVFKYLDARKPLATELYVIGCEYVPMGLSIGTTVRDGFGRDQVAHDIRDALKRYLWSLPPDGPQNEGWPLGRAVSDRELEVIAGRVRGVATVTGINLFVREVEGWRMIARDRECDPVTIALDPWQLPELLGVVVSTDGTVSDSPLGFSDPGAGGGVAVPVIPEACL